MGASGGRSIRPRTPGHTHDQQASCLVIPTRVCPTWVCKLKAYTSTNTTPSATSQRRLCGSCAQLAAPKELPLASALLGLHQELPCTHRLHCFRIESVFGPVLLVTSEGACKLRGAREIKSGQFACIILHMNVLAVQSWPK
jgi:hypothetical protein